MKIVRFDGMSQMFSSYDFGGLLNDYTILTVARHTADKKMQLSHLSGLIGYLDLEQSGYWKLGSTVLSGPSEMTVGICSVNS